MSKFRAERGKNLSNSKHSLLEKYDSRRKALRSIFVGTSFVALSDQWKKPIINSVILPTHAATSEDSDSRPAPTPPPSCEPGSLSLSFTTDTLVVFNTQQIVEFTLVVTNTGTGVVNSFSISESGGQLSSQSGGPIAPGQSVTFTESRSFTWSLGQNIELEAVLTGEDDCGNQLNDIQSISIPTFGANMAIYTNQESVKPGDELEVVLVSRLYASGIEDAQWIDMRYRCNLLKNVWRPGGPGDKYWADPSDDFVSQREGANKLALDMHEGRDHGDQPDWVHKLIYTVPEDLTTDLVVNAEDTGNVRVYADGQWSSDLPVENGYAEITLPLVR